MARALRHAVVSRLARTLGLTQHLRCPLMSWRLLHLGPKGETVLIAGANIWDREWKTQGEECAVVKHPKFPNQVHRLGRYFVEVAGKAHEFAAAEVSPGIWLLFVPAPRSEHLMLVRLAAFAVAIAGSFILVHGFDQSPTYIALGSALIALAIAADWYATAQGRASEA